MNKILRKAFLILLSISSTASAQDKKELYLGLSYGLSIPLGNFADDDLSDRKAGFAENGIKFDLFGGTRINEKLGAGFTFRYQNYPINIDNQIDRLEEQFPNRDFEGTADEWETYALLFALTYKVNLTPKFAIYPRAGLGPYLVKNPGFSVSSTDGSLSNAISRSSETGFGMGYEFGIGLRNNIGKRILLVPTFTFSGGWLRINDVETETDNLIITSDYEPDVFTFNLGLSIAYRLK